MKQQSPMLIFYGHGMPYQVIFTNDEPSGSRSHFRAISLRCSMARRTKRRRDAILNPKRTWSITTKISNMDLVFRFRMLLQPSSNQSEVLPPVDITVRVPVVRSLGPSSQRVEIA